ncbi:MAG: flexitail domain-containing putative surface protein [Dehalococcoidia bacterium]
MPGYLAAQAEITVALNKSGGEASGSVLVVEDLAPPLDCVGATATVGSVTFTPLAQSHDEDQDGCADWEELGSAQGPGGLRDPFNFWDFFDTPDTNNVRDKAISAGDMTRVIARYGTTGDPNINPLSQPPPTGYHPAFDRGDSLGPGNWNRDAANGSITVADVSAVVNQFGHTCFAAP